MITKQKYLFTKLLTWKYNVTAWIIIYDKLVDFFTFQDGFQMLFGINRATRVRWIVHKYGFGSVVNQWFKVINVNLPRSFRLKCTWFQKETVILYLVLYSQGRRALKIINTQISFSQQTYNLQPLNQDIQNFFAKIKFDVPCGVYGALLLGHLTIV